MFVDPPSGNYRLQADSPCIDAGNNWGVPQDTLDLDGDGKTKELIPFDLDGNPRFRADPVDFDPGCGVPVVVDMGAYEFEFGPGFEVVFADIIVDGCVNVPDLLYLLSKWGTNDCLADLDVNCSVTVSDLLALLANWWCPSH